MREDSGGSLRDQADLGPQECVTGWQPIDSAPKDDPDFQALACHQVNDASWAYYIINRHDIGGRYECWVVPPGRPVSPTHWSLLPLPPIDSPAGLPASEVSHPSLASAASGMLAALEPVYAACLSGDFYADHDEACRLLGLMRTSIESARAALSKES